MENSIHNKINKSKERIFGKSGAPASEVAPVSTQNQNMSLASSVRHPTSFPFHVFSAICKIKELRGVAYKLYNLPLY